MPRVEFRRRNGRVGPNGAQLSATNPDGYLARDEKTAAAWRSAAQGVQKLSDDYVQRKRGQKNAQQLMAADMAASEAFRNAMHGENGIMLRQGVNATGATDEFAKLSREQGEQLAARISDPEARLRFQEMYMRRQESALNTIAQHEGGQLTRARDEDTQAYIANAVADAEAAPGDMQAAADARARVITAIDANYRGRGGEEIERVKTQALDELHGKIAGQLAEADPERAMAYIKANGDEMTPATVARFEKVAAEQKFAIAEQSAADQIMEQAPDMATGLEAARTIKDPALRDAVVDRVKSRFNERAQIAKENERQLTQAAWAHVENGGTYESLPAAVRAELPGTVKKRLRAWHQKTGGGAKPVKTDFMAYREAATAIADGQDIDLADYRDRISTSDLKSLLKAQGKTADGADAEPDITRVQAIQVAERSLRELGFATGTSKRAMKDAERIAPFYEQYERALNDFEKANGRRPNAVEAQAITDDLLIPGKIEKPGWFNDESEAFSFERSGLGPDDTFTVDDADRIPADERADIERALAARGRDVTDDAVLQLYQAGLARRGVLE